LEEAIRIMDEDDDDGEFCHEGQAKNPNETGGSRT
jgi:hypothetical protein